jgi:hypothetical protein
MKWRNRRSALRKLDGWPPFNDPRLVFPTYAELVAQEGYRDNQGHGFGEAALQCSDTEHAFASAGSTCMCGRFAVSRVVASGVFMVDKEML